MKHTAGTIIMLTFVLSALFGRSGFAQNGEMQKELPDEIKRFEGMLGDWSAKAKGMIEGKAVSMDYHISFRKIADGSGIYADEWFDSKESGKDGTAA